ncbi:hypothetical protein MB901379_04657 [Mycobacterium basiliense]|uniref:Uncharacterized protein n=1 Tax=Mycobacterium basiliense TaxID=2094119 RepID=A0A447GKT1_9MYCO|nr:hypothetical protein [Mycobacterium basiliense]VDM91043.1 hypothetical protein MB901379_04657 [Mycobacterium basiliense]
MRLVAESGLWTTATSLPAQPTSPLAAVLEVSGAVFSWTIDDPAADAATQITFTDVSRADWLWRVVGESGHVALASALAERTAGDFELSEVDIAPRSVAGLRRLALGHWMRRWWPTSQRDGIAELDRALLDVEVALLTLEAQGFFTDETLDSDVAGLLAPHAADLLPHARTDDPRIRDMVQTGTRLAEEVGLDGARWVDLSAAVDGSPVILTMPSRRRDDYALAAGPGTGPGPASPIGGGIASIIWSAVPPGIFDAAEDTVEWSVEQTGPAVVAIVHAAVIGPRPATDIPVQVRSGDVHGTGALDAGGRATVPLLDAQRRALAEHVAWNHPWPTTSVVIGARISSTAESRQTRERVRRWVRSRLDQPPEDAFLAEILASESAY